MSNAHILQGREYGINRDFSTFLYPDEIVKARLDSGLTIRTKIAGARYTHWFPCATCCRRESCATNFQAGERHSNALEFVTRRLIG